MADDREDAKAADALLKLSKIQGWLGYDPDSSMFKTLQSLNQSELDELRRRLLAKKEDQEASNEATVEPSHIN